MRNLSCQLTTAQIINRTKFVTRRLGWWNVKVGELLCVCEKCQGLRRGEALNRLSIICVVDSRPEPLRSMLREPYGTAEAKLEGFPEMNGRQFVTMFRAHMRCHPNRTINRIQFEYV